MIVTYLTEDDVLVSVRLRKGDTWEATVEGAFGMARWESRNLSGISPRWPTERVARHALEWAQSLPEGMGCPCLDPECPGKSLTDPRDVFGPTDPHKVKMTGPWVDSVDAARVAAALQCGEIDEEEAASYAPPSLAEIAAKMDGKPEPRKKTKDEYPDPHNGSTWRLG